MAKYYIGIDSDKKGAVFVLKDDKPWSFYCFKSVDGFLVKSELHEIKNKIQDEINEPSQSIICYLGKPLPIWEGAEKLWRNFERLDNVFSPDSIVTANEWQKGLGFDRGHSKKQALSLAKADTGMDFLNTNKNGQKLKTINQGLADAYCIAKYAYLKDNFLI